MKEESNAYIIIIIHVYMYPLTIRDNGGFEVVEEETWSTLAVSASVDVA